MFEVFSGLELLICYLMALHLYYYIYYAAQESFGRMHYTGKEIASATKILPELFPNKVTINAPKVCASIVLSCVARLLSASDGNNIHSRINLSLYNGNKCYTGTHKLST